VLLLLVLVDVEVASIVQFVQLGFPNFLNFGLFFFSESFSRKGNTEET
jgi:hypothetical protein